MGGHPPLQPGWIDRPHQRFELGDQVLESGEVLQQAFVSYVMHGDLSRPAAGVVLALTAIGSTHHRLDFLIGPGRPLDTERFTVIVVDALGNGLSSSPSNSVAQPGADFPRFGLRDMVESQRRLLDHLGIGRLAAVVGASMGGMQALQWGVSHPQRMDTIVAMTPMATTSRWSQLVNEMSRRALFTDAACRVPRDRADAMRLWAPLTQLLMPRSPAALAQAFPTMQALHEHLHERALHLAGHGPDPFDWCFQSWAYDAHDIGATPTFCGDTTAALRSIAARVLVLAPALDLYNPSEEARQAARAIPGARFVDLPGDAGHASASGTDAASTRALCEALSRFLSSP